MNHPFQIDRESTVGRTEGKAFLTNADSGKVIRLARHRLFFELAVSFQNPNLLIQLFDLLFQILDCIGRVIGPQRLVGNRLTAYHDQGDCPSVHVH